MTLICPEETACRTDQLFTDAKFISRSFQQLVEPPFEFEFYAVDSHLLKKYPQEM